MIPRAFALAATMAAAGACVMRDPAPRYPEKAPAFGFAPPDFDADVACGSWDWATDDLEAKKHVCFPEVVSAASCYAEVVYEIGSDRIAAVGEPAAGCGYPDAGAAAALLARAAVYDRIAARPRPGKGDRVPIEVACELSAEDRRIAAATNARTLRSLAGAVTRGELSRVYPYAVAGTFGYGAAAHGESKLLRWTPGRPCVALRAADRALLGVNVARAARVSEAFRAGVAPLVSTSGGAVHSPLVEAFMLAHLATCDGGVPLDRILVDPCADHTHTNMRNTGAMISGIGARHAYLVTDDGIQSDYLQEWTAFELIGGSIDQRARRDWGYLIGAWRQASRGIDAGFWYTPFRFWSEPRGGLGSFQCVGDVVWE